jgi:uncharacterized membrane protein
MNTLHSGISFAASAAIVAVAAAATATPSVAADHAKQVHCYGINTCKGTSDCKTAHNDCKGHEQLQGAGLQDDDAGAVQGRRRQPYRGGAQVIAPRRRFD